MGPILRIVEAYAMNKVLKKCLTRYGSEIRINNLSYVYDIVGVGNSIVLEDVVNYIKLLEENKC